MPAGAFHATIAMAHATSTAVFLDRDDTLIAANSLPPPAPPGNVGDVTDSALVALLPGAFEACAALKRAGFKLVIITNQGAVARGAITIAEMNAINARVCAVLTPGGSSVSFIDAVYACPWHPKGNVMEFTREHPWRKPQPGMILAAAGDLSIDLARSWLIGDGERDIQAGIAAGIAPDRCLRVTAEFGIESAAAQILGRR